MSLGSLVEFDAAHPFSSMSLPYSGGHGAASGVRLNLGPSGVVAARGFEIEEALLGAVGTAIGPAFGIAPG